MASIDAGKGQSRDQSRDCVVAAFSGFPSCVGKTTLRQATRAQIPSLQGGARPAQHSTAQHSSAQHSSAQHSTHKGDSSHSSRARCTAQRLGQFHSHSGPYSAVQGAFSTTSPHSHITMSLIFNNALVPSPGVLAVQFTLKERKGVESVANQPCRIANVSIDTQTLNSSILYNMSQIEEEEEDTSQFLCTLCNLDTIKRLSLTNDNIDFNIEYLGVDGSVSSLPFSISILNLIQLNIARSQLITKSMSHLLLDINFQMREPFSSSFVNALSLHLSSSSNTCAIDDVSEITSLESDLASVSSSAVNSTSNLNLNHRNKNKSSSSLSSHSKKSLVKYLTHNRSKSRSKSDTNTSTNTRSLRSVSPSLIAPSPLKSSSIELKSSSGSPSASASTSSLDIATTNPDLYHDDTDGFLILQIESATGLPPFKNSTHLGFDMDPFVVVSFSKQIYKTAVCRHALNPSWKNQLINIRVSKYSFNFNIKLSVYDFDFFTFNDDICFTSINIEKLIKESEYNHDDAWTYKKLPLSFSPKVLSKKSNTRTIKLNEFQPELSIRFKYVSLSKLIPLKHDFNPTKCKCPYCGEIDKRNKSAYQHLSICTLNLKPKEFLHKQFTTSNHASRRWYSKILAHIAYGRLTVGGNNAHILVQDRITGLILEEKISAFVKLGIRLLYKSVKSDNSSERIKKMLRKLSIKQGSRYDKPESKSRIAGFVKFHGLNGTLNECLKSDLSSYETFNDFFCRKLKPGARPIEGGVNNDIIVSVADSRLICFNNVNNAQKLWIKGRGFTIEKLLGKERKNFTNKNNNDNIDNDYDHDDDHSDDHNTSDGMSIAIFRLAPQDYHRVHCPLNGKIIKITHIHGTYYTVNPMAIRSSLDVFGENIRTVVSLETIEYGVVEIVLVGAMMVGSIIITAKLNEEIKKGQEVGFFKFGGSTVVLIFPVGKIEWDGDLISNSNKKLETLVKVGMSVGHSIDVEGLKMGFKKEVTDIERQEVIRRVTGVGEGYGVGISVGDNIKAKIGGMIDDVMSLKSRKSTTIDELMSNDWEIQELTTLDGLNDAEVADTDADADADVEIQLAVPEPEEWQLYESVE